ncbi:MAG: peptidoglycan-associated lipoprotein Pal [Vicinamibacteria bacterium]|nr:peptidoglycan-associated lipoprotein Pal [Vicinamibacteria bacterium]
MHARRLNLLAAVVLAVFALACGGGKRPSALTQPPPPPPPGTGSTYGGPRPQPVDAGPDVVPLDGEGVAASDFEESRADGEGGPLADVLFGYDQANLSDEGRALVERHAVWLQARREAKIIIEGHCDERGTVEYNLALGELRARAVRDLLVSLGVDGARLNVVSYGKERPLDGGSGEASWARNRRAHFVVRR